MSTENTDNHISIPQKIWSFLKNILLFIKKRWYHIILLALSTGYLLRNHFKIEKLDDFSLNSSIAFQANQGNFLSSRQNSKRNDCTHISLLSPSPADR